LVKEGGVLEISKRIKKLIWFFFSYFSTG